jgi:hypothetical protein
MLVDDKIGLRYIVSTALHAEIEIPKAIQAKPGRIRIGLTYAAAVGVC